MNPTINFPPGYIQGVPFSNECRNLKVSKLSEECISISRSDWNAFETSWDFKRHPLISVISKNRALLDDITDIDLAECYTCWENECNERFNQLKANEE